MKHHLLIALGLLSLSSAGAATVTTFTSAAAFQSFNLGSVVIENFDDAAASNLNTHLPSYAGPGGQISFTPLSAFPLEPNVVIATPGGTEFIPGVAPPASNILTASGNEDFVGTLAAPATALGFDVYLNNAPLTITFFNGDLTIGAITFDAPAAGASNLVFAGIASTEGVTGFRWMASEAQRYDTGIDNIVVAGVPEPSTWAMLLAGFGILGCALRRRRVSQRALV